MTNINDAAYQKLIDNITTLWGEAKSKAIAAVNTELLDANWQTGKYIVEFEQGGKQRAEYGKEIVVTLSRQLQDNFGKGFDEKNLRRMMQFANAIEKQKVVTLSRQLSWSHFLALLPLQESLKIEFYAQMSIVQNWGVRTLRERIDSMLYERTALSKQPEELIKYELDNSTFAHRFQ